MNNGLVPLFANRDFSSRPAQPPGPWQVERCTWAALGGPESAWISAPLRPGAEESAWNLLRCPVTLLDAQGQPAWWGYVNAVELRRGTSRTRRSLERMINTVRVEFRYVSAGGALRVWARDDESRACYGEKEWAFDLGLVHSQAQAEEAARTHLERSRGTAAGWRGGLADGGTRLRLELRGWYATLSWRFDQWSGQGEADYDAEPDDEGSIGYSSGVARANQPFQCNAGGPPWAAAALKLSLRKVGSPGDLLRASIQADLNGVPDGADLDSAEIQPWQLSSSLGWIEVQFPRLNTRIQPGRSYHLVLARSGALSSSNYYKLGLLQVQPVMGMTPYRYWNGSSWVQRSPLSIAVYHLWGLADTGDLLAGYTAPEAGGQFLAGVDGPGQTGRWDSPRREPLLDLRRRVNELLAAGTASGERLLAQVDPERVLRIFSAPPADRPTCLAALGGTLTDLHGRGLLPRSAPAGQWARCEGQLMFIERVEWRAGQLRVCE